MIVGGKIISVEAKRTSEEPITGLDINIAIDNVKVNGGGIEIKYLYTAKYAKDVGFLKIEGILNASEENAKAKSIGELWGKEKRLPDDFAELVLNTINFTCGTNGTLVVRPVNLSPPMIPPRIELAKGKEAKGST